MYSDGRSQAVANRPKADGHINHLHIQRVHPFLVMRPHA